MTRIWSLITQKLLIFHHFFHSQFVLAFLQFLMLFFFFSVVRFVPSNFTRVRSYFQSFFRFSLNVSSKIDEKKKVLVSVLAVFFIICCTNRRIEWKNNLFFCWPDETRENYTTRREVWKNRQHSTARKHEEENGLGKIFMMCRHKNVQLETSVEQH